MSLSNRKKGDLKNAIHNQLIFIKNSCKLFDEGCIEEAIRIAAAINVLIEKRKRNEGILRKITYEFKFLSTVPLVEDVKSEKLITLTCNDLEELKSKVSENEDAVKNKLNVLIIYVRNIKKCYVYAIDYRGQEVNCPIESLEQKYIEKREVQTRMKMTMVGWLKINPDDPNPFKDIDKRKAIERLDMFLGFPTNYVSSLYFPMITDFDIGGKPVLDDAQHNRYVSINDWINEIIFCVPDVNREYLILTREDLIKSARDQDGGGHFDLNLKVPSYIKSRDGYPLMKINGKEISTQNYHLIMLRQIGYEVLNSPSILEYLDKI